MAGFPRDLQHQAVGKAQRRTAPKVRERRRHDVGLLHRQMLMTEQHLDGGCDLLMLETIFDTLNAKAAIVALEEVYAERGAVNAERRTAIRTSD